MSNRYERIAEGLTVQPLLDALAQHPGLWGQITARQDMPGSPHKDTQCIFLRWPADQSIWAAFHDLTNEDYPAAKVLAPAASHLVHDVVVEHLGIPGAQLGRVLLTKLKPGGVIIPHFDQGPYADQFDRFHVVLDAADGNVITVDGQDFIPVTGDLFWFNHKLVHSYRNESDRPRLHLIIDVVAPVYRAKRGLTFQRERAHDLWDTIMPLLQEHKDEIAHYPDILLNPDQPAYEQAEEHGLLRCYVARLNGDLVGYGIFFVKRNMHYRDSLQAVQDVLFVTQAHRHGRVGLKLIQYATEQLRAEQIQVEYQHTKANAQIREALKALKGRTDIGKLMESLGYELIDLIYGKRLDR